MGNSALDVTALAVGTAGALLITVALWWALRDDDARRGWIVAGVVFLVLLALAIVDLLRYTPRETTFSTVIVGVALPVFGTLGVVRATRRVKPWARWTVAFTTAFLLLFGGFLLGATLARWLPV